MAPPHSSSAGWFGDLDGIFGRLFYGIGFTFVVGIGVFIGTVVFGAILFFGLKPKAYWSFAGYPAALVALIWACYPLAALSSDESGATAGSAVHNILPQPQPPAQADVPVQPTPSPSTPEALLGNYFFRAATLEKASKQEPKYEGAPAWPLIVTYAQPGITIDDVKRFYSSQGVLLESISGAWRGEFSRAGDHVKTHVMFSESTKGETAGHLVIFYWIDLERH